LLQAAARSIREEAAAAATSPLVLDVVLDEVLDDIVCLLGADVRRDSPDVVLTGPGWS